VKPLLLLPAALLALLVVTGVPATASPGLMAPTAAATEPFGAWPLSPQPAVVRGFDPPEVTWGSGHRGVDLAGSVGQPVRAAVQGRISYVGSIAGVGVVVVDHGATRTTYQPVAARVEVGTVVATGAVIGVLRWYGTHCLPAACLHWGLVQGDRYLDPLTLVGGPSPVRLLPLEGAPALQRQLTAPAVVTSAVRYGYLLPGFALGP